MSSELLASKIVIQEEAPRIRNIPAGPTAVLLAVGIAERGPVGVQQVVTSFEDYAKIFGGITADAQDLPIAIQGFFENGGSRAHVTRTVHYTDITSAATKTSLASTFTLLTAALGATSGTKLSANAEPFNLAPGDTLDFSIDGGGTDTATFDAAAASFTGTNTETFALADGQTLTLEIDDNGVQTITFNTAEFVDIANATAAEVAAVINGEIVGASSDTSAGAVRITSDSQGTGSEIDITGGTAAATLGMTVGVTNGTGDAADISAVTAAEVVAVLTADIAGAVAVAEAGAIRVTSSTTGPASSVQIEATSTADTKFGFDNATDFGNAAGTQNTLKVDGKSDGTYGNDLDIVIADATSGVASEFNLSVEENGVVLEIFPNLSMTDTDTNFVEDVINDATTGSDLITVTDQDAPLTSPDDRPANGTFSMTGGDDGLASLDDNDFIGSTVSKTGIRSFDTVNEGRLLIVPGRATSAVQNSMLTYCEITRDKSIFAVLDPPASQTAAQIVTYVKTTAALKESSEFGAIYWPRVEIGNPSTAIFGNVERVVVPPSGHICGLMARVDAGLPSGVFEAPAGVQIESVNGRLAGVLGVETDEVNEEPKRDLVFPELINPIIALEGLPIHIDGARTLKSTENFPTIGERRGVIFAEQSIKDGILFGKHRKITPRKRAEIERAVDLFLLIQTNNGAFASTDPNQAFFTDFSDALNPASVAFARQIIGRIGLATAKPAEFIIVRVSQDTRALDEELALAA